MRARKSFWEKPELAPTHLKNFEDRNYFVHRMVGQFENIPDIIKQGLMSTKMRERITTQKLDSEFSLSDDFHDKVLSSVEPKENLMLGHLPTFVFRNEKAARSWESRHWFSEYEYKSHPIRVAPRDFMAVILHQEATQEMIRSAVEACAAKKVPLYHPQGHRIWPPVRE